MPKGCRKNGSFTPHPVWFPWGSADLPLAYSEARSLNMQSNELAQAESLEREAQMHRDRAAMGGGGECSLNLTLNVTSHELYHRWWRFDE